MRNSIFLIALIICSELLFAQSQNNFNYQAVIRNNTGELLINKAIDVQITIIESSASGPEIYSETHSVTTSNEGLINLQIGNGSSINDNFNSIDWGADAKYLKIELNTGSGYQNIGTFQLLSVPYALYADVASTAELLGSKGVYSTSTDTLFVVKDHSGNVVFAVFPDGAQVIVNETAKGKVGGFAISGRSPSKAIDIDILKITADSTRVYVNDTVTAKGKVGGFAVSGRSPSKNINNDLLLITADSTRIYVNDPNTKGKVGGFAVSGRSPSKGNSSPFMDLTSINYFIGHQSGVNINTGTLNSTLGYESGVELTSGSNNAFLGYQSGYNTNTGSGNLFLGYQSGYNNIVGNYNSFMGYQAGYANVSGTNNSFLGSFTGKNNIEGSYNTFVGDSSGFNNISGSSNSFFGTKVGFNNTIGWANLFLGNFAGFSNEGGFENVFIGDHSGYSNIASGMNVAIGVRSGYYGEDGWNNVYIGTETGYNNIDGEGNVFIGFQTGMNNTNGTRNIFIGNRAGMDEQGSSKLIIDNQDLDSTSTFIWGDLNARFLRFNSWIGIGTNPTYAYNLSVYNESAPAIINLLGGGNAYDFSQLRLEADTGTDTLGYHFIHDVDHRLRILFDDGTNFFPRFSIDSTGKVMIGGPWVDATEMLDVDGNARFRAVGSAAQVNDIGITADGVLTTSTSDKRLKEDITLINNSLDKVLKLNGYTFNWKGKESIKKDAGLIAQEVEEIFPEAVFINPNDGYFGINYSRFPALFVEAFKEQNNNIEQMRREIENLKSENEQLKQKLNEIIEMLGKE